MASEPKVYESLFRMPRLIPALIAVLILGLFLLFFRELPYLVQNFLLPSLAVYALGAALLGMFHRLIAITYANPSEHWNEHTIPIIMRVILYGIHISWFAALIRYNFWRGVL